MKGLVSSAGKAIAQLPACEDAIARLKRVDSREAFEEFLESVDLGMAPPAARELTAAITGEDWRDHHAHLVLAVDVAYHNRMSPSA